MPRYFAELDSNKKVIRVIVADQAFINSGTVGNPANWVETHMDGSKRKNYAGPGYTYDQGRDAFIAPKPFQSWNLNEISCKYEAPKERPKDGKVYRWNESIVDWEPHPAFAVENARIDNQIIN